MGRVKNEKCPTRGEGEGNVTFWDSRLSLWAKHSDWCPFWSCSSQKAGKNCTFQGLDEHEKFELNVNHPHPNGALPQQSAPLLGYV